MANEIQHGHPPWEMEWPHAGNPGQGPNAGGGDATNMRGLAARTVAPAPPRVATQPIRVLLVEDKRGLSRIVRAMLADAEAPSFKVTAAGKIADGLGQFRQFPFDVVLLNLPSPDCQGVSSVRILARAIPDIPIVVLTETDDEQSGLAAIQAGAQDYLVGGTEDAALLGRTIRFAIQRQRTERDLLASQARFQSQVESLPDGILLYDRSGIRFANPAAMDMLGAASEQELLDHPVTQFLTTGHEPDLAQKLDQVISEGFRFPGFTEGECRPLDGTGRVECEWLAFPLSDSVTEYGQLILRDTRSRKQADNHLRLATTVFEASSEGMMVWDGQGRIEMVNQAFVGITGYTAAEVVGREARLLDAGHNGRGFFAAIGRALREKGHWRGDYRARRKSGEVFVARLALSAIRDDRGQMNAFVAVFSDVTEEKAQEAAINHLANHDPLTGLPNRRLFFDRLSQALADRHREPQDHNRLALLFVDLDDFKRINDAYGHEAGDSLLKQMATRIRKTLREGDTVARLGGDEFVILLKRLPKEETAEELAEKVFRVIGEPLAVNGGGVEVGASIGIVIAPKHGNTPEMLMARADHAMYRSKEAGKNRYASY